METPVRPPPIKLQRVENFTDEVFVVAMTLLVLTIGVPALAPGEGQEELAARLRGLVPNIVVAVVGFLYLSAHWKAIHIQVRPLRRYDQTLLAILILLLAAIAFVPFTIALLGLHWDEPIALLLFSAHNVLVLLLLAWHWHHLSGKPKLLAEPLSAAYRRRVMLRTLVPVAPIGAVGLLAFVAPLLSAALFVVGVLLWSLPGISSIVWYRGDRERREEASPDGEEPAGGDATG